MTASPPLHGCFVTGTGAGKTHVRAALLHRCAQHGWRSGGLSLTRDASLAYTDPGSGHAALREKGAGVELGYGFALAPAKNGEVVPPDEFGRWPEVKREQEEAGGAVRIMTVHGAKGLQAPLVILPRFDAPLRFC